MDKRLFATAMQWGTLTLVAGMILSDSVSANSLYFAMPVNFFVGGTLDTVFVYGAPGIAGTVSSPGGFSSGFTIGASKVASVALPSSAELATSGLVTNNGFVVSTNNASDKVSASYLSRGQGSTDTTYLFDASSLGTTYYAVGYQRTLSGFPSQLSIVGTAPGTIVTITPSAGGFTSGQPAGVPFTVTLNAGQAVLFNSNTDVTGSFITSSAPIAVFGGNDLTFIPAGVGLADHVLTALPSTDHYTKSAIVPLTAFEGGGSFAGNIVRVLSGTAATTVKFNGAVVATLNAGQYFDFTNGTGGEITADQPVLVNEYLTSTATHGNTDGDPSQTYIPGEDQWLKDYIFSTPVGTGAQGAFALNFLDIAIATVDVSSLLLNGGAIPASDCAVLAGTLFSTCDVAIAAGSGEISAANPFLLLIDGAAGAESYLTFANAPPPNSTPEPATLALLALGLAGLGFSRRKQ